MATALSEKLISLRGRVAHFAQEYISCRDDLQSLDGIPKDLWDKMGEDNLLGLSLPTEYGGLGGNYLSMAVAGETLVRKGHNMGIAVSWLTHLNVARFLIMGFGSKTQLDLYLKGLAGGKKTACIAVSEPGRGAHPKYIETSGYRNGDFYILNGEKAYLTNGPMADLFIVIASTGIDEGRKRFSAFLIPKETTGLSLTKPMKFDFFRPSPHGGIKLSNCSVPASNILGEEGSAYEDMVKPFRDVEDALMMGPLVGAMGRQVELLLNLFEKNCVDITDELKKDMGDMQSIIHTLRIVAYEAASVLDSPVRHAEFYSLLISSRNLARQFQDLFEFVIKRAGIEQDNDLYVSSNDLVHGIDSGKRIALIKLKKLGERLLSRKDSDEHAP